MTIIDAQVSTHGSLTMIRPLTLRANRWITRHCHVESWQWLGGALCIDYRSAAAIVRGMKRSRLKVDHA